MKKCFCAILSLVLVLSLASCGASSSSKETSQKSAQQTQQTNPQAPADLSPKKAAEETDKIVSVLVTLSQASMDKMNDYLSGFGTAYTADNLISYSKTEISEIYKYLDGLEDLPDTKNSGTYVQAAEDCINCACAAWIYLRDYLEDGKDSDLNNLKTNVVGFPLLLEVYLLGRAEYLSSAGFSNEEVLEITGISLS